MIEIESSPCQSLLADERPVRHAGLVEGDDLAVQDKPGRQLGSR